MPHKVWVVGEEVLAADFNNYVQEQVIATFANAAARTAAIAAPTVGMATWLTDSQAFEIWDGAAWSKPYNMPRGVLFLGTQTTGQTGLLFDVTNLATTVNMIAGRRYQSAVKVEVYSSVAGDNVDVELCDAAGVILDTATTYFVGAVSAETVAWTYTETAALTAAVTRKIRIRRSAGTGTLTLRAEAQRPATYTITDLGVA
jgi:hypothetical protein